MQRLGSRSRLSYFFLGWLLFQLAGSLEAAPVVSSISPNAARVGEVLQVKGAGFNDTKEVLFVSGTAVKPAKFTVVTDKRLDVTFPEYYRGAGSASIIVVGAEGVTVAMSDEMKTVDAHSLRIVTAPFLHVVQDAVINEAKGLAVIEAGAAVAKCESSPVCFVKHKGALAEFTGDIIFYERGAIFGAKIKARRPPPKLIPLHEITVSPSIDSVLIKIVDVPRPFAKEPPVLLSVAASFGMPGDVVELKGEHLRRVSNVYFLNPSRGLQDAGFKATNDNLLRVEIPQDAFGRQMIVVRNPVGIAVSIGDKPSPRFQLHGRVAEERAQRYSSVFKVFYVGGGKTVESTGGRYNVVIDNGGIVAQGSTGGRSIVVIENGGVVTQAGGDCYFLVRNGGLLGPPRGGGVIFYESDAKVPFQTGTQIQPAGLKINDVGTINFTRHPFIFDVGDIDRRI